MKQPVQPQDVVANNGENDEPVTISLMLPYAGDKGEQIVTKLQKYVESTVNKSENKIRPRITYRAKRLSSKFNVKDKTKTRHSHNIVYHAICAKKTCTSHYVGQTKCRLEKRALQHRDTDKKSHIYKHCKSTKHKRVHITDFEILGKGYRSDFTRKISESLYIKRLSPNLNIQKDSYKLALFN